MEPNITKNKNDNDNDFRVTLGIKHNYSVVFIAF